MGNEISPKASGIIAEIASTTSKRQTFAYFTPDDIAQEIWVICVRALGGYNESLGSLEHFLRRCVNNRLRNLRRDRYFRPSYGDKTKDAGVKARISIVNAASLNSPEHGDAAVFSTLRHVPEPQESVMASDLAISLMQIMPSGLLLDFQALLDGESIPAASLWQIREIAANELGMEI